MSDLRHFCDAQKARKAPEKSHFVQTCNLLSRYMKEKGSLKDLNLEIGGKVESLEAIVKPGSSSSHYVSSASTTMKNKEKSALDSSINTVEEDASFKPTSKEGTTTTDPKTAPLTIFYAGRVLVFDDYPVEKAKELVAFAKKGSSQMSYGIWSNTLPAKSSPAAGSGGGTEAATSSPREGLPPRPQASCSATGVGISSNTCTETKNSQAKEKANGSDMPIARRSSLHRFLEKRKDRAAARGPYQIQEQPPCSSSKGDEQLELKL